MVPLAQAPIAPVDVGIVSQDSNYATIQSLRPSQYLSTALNLLLGLAGVASLVYLLWGGIQWILAGGDKDAVEKARKKIVAALIGITIVFSSYVILFTVRSVFNIDLIQFNLESLGSLGGGGIGNGGGPPTAPGNPNCAGCGGTNCGITGQIYIGTGGICYLCDTGGWTQNAGPCYVNTCGTCP